MRVQRRAAAKCAHDYATAITKACNGLLRHIGANPGDAADATRALDDAQHALQKARTALRKAARASTCAANPKKAREKQRDAMRLARRLEAVRKSGVADSLDQMEEFVTAFYPKVRPGAAKSAAKRLYRACTLQTDSSKVRCKNTAQHLHALRARLREPTTARRARGQKHTNIDIGTGANATFPAAAPEAPARGTTPDL